MLVGAGFFGYMLALLQCRVGTIVSSQNVSTQFFLLPTLSTSVCGVDVGFCEVCARCSRRNYLKLLLPLVCE